MYFTDESGGNVRWCCMYVSSYAIVFMLCCSWRNCSDRVVMLEASVETYKRKLENLGDLKRQMKLLEENNMTYMQNTVSLEEELRKANAARAQLETYKRQVSDTQSRVRNPKIPSQTTLTTQKMGCTSARCLKQTEFSHKEYRPIPPVSHLLWNSARDWLTLRQSAARIYHFWILSLRSKSYTRRWQRRRGGQIIWPSRWRNWRKSTRLWWRRKRCGSLWRVKSRNFVFHRVLVNIHGFKYLSHLFQRIIMERESLKEINEELRCSQAQQHQLSQAGTSQNKELLQYNHNKVMASSGVLKW